MSITSSLIADDNLQADGRRSIREIHTDHIDKEYWFQYKTAAETDVEALMASRVPQLEMDISENELEDVVGQVYDGVDHTTIVLNYNTKAVAFRRLLKRFYNYPSWDAWNLIALIDSLTDQQIMNSLEVSQAIVDKVRARVLKLKTIEADVEIADADVEVI